MTQSVRQANTSHSATTFEWIESERFRTDNELATRFIDQHGKDLRFVIEWGSWIVWDGKRWLRDPNGTILLGKARSFSAGMWTSFASIAPKDLTRDEINKIRTFCRVSNSDNGIKSFLNLAKADTRILIHFDRLDVQVNLLNVQNGTIDLCTGELKPHSSDDLLTQIANVSHDAKADCDLWTKSLSIIFDGDSTLIKYLQQLLGYSISGDIGQNILPIAYGSGCNGKSMLWNTVLSLLGDYAGLANDSLLLGLKDGHPGQSHKVDVIGWPSICVME